MLELKEYTKSDFKAIFGKNKKGLYFFDVWLKKYPILENNDVFKWITTKVRKFAQKSNKEAKDFNINSYLKALNDYCLYNKVSNPSELLQENIDMRNKRVVDYLVYLIKVEKKNEVSVKNAYQSRIKSFYSARGSPITDGLETEQNGINENEMSLDRDKIQAILNMINNSNYKLASKVQSLLGLRIGDVLKELPKYKILKHSKHYYIKNFLTIKENVKIKYLFFPNELTKLFQSIYNIKDLTKLDLSTKLLKTRKSEKKGNKVILQSEYLRKLKNIVEGVTKLLKDKNGKIIKDENNKAKVEKDKDGKPLRFNGLYPNEVMRTHSFRKYFATQISRVNLTAIRNDIGSDVESNFKEHLLGHKVHYSSKVYNQILNDINQFYELWKPLENSLCIDCEIVDNTNQEVLELKEKNIKLENQIKTLLKSKIETDNKLEIITNKLDKFFKVGGGFGSEIWNEFVEKEKPEKDIIAIQLKE